MKIIEHAEGLPRKTESLCPECKKTVPAEVFERDGKVWLKKTCKYHGEQEELYWGDVRLYNKAKNFAQDGKEIENPNTEENRGCPWDCGLCPRHKSHTALGNIVLTNRCDLACWYCFFYAKEGQPVYEPSLEQIRKMMEALRVERPIGCNALQLTGGEPTMRDDLVDIIKMAREVGFDHIQLNTDGVKMAHDPQVARDVRKAGVNTLYLSFDGVTAKTNPKNHWEVPHVIESCRKTTGLYQYSKLGRHNPLGIIFVPTVINGVNDHELGGIIEYAVKNSDVVRGVNFQPVSLVGRMSRQEREKQRITIPDAIKKIDEQVDWLSADDFYPVPCVAPITNLIEVLTGKPRYKLTAHFACGMATYAVRDKKRGMVPITKFVDIEGLMEFFETEAGSMQNGGSKVRSGMNMVKRLRGFVDLKEQPRGLNFAKILFKVLVKNDYEALGELQTKSMFIGMMHFMDPYNYDVARVQRCEIHYAVPDGRIIPFCSFNVVPEEYRDVIQAKYSVPADVWEKRTGKKLSEDKYRRKLDENGKLVLQPPERKI